MLNKSRKIFFIFLLSVLGLVLINHFFLEKKTHLTEQNKNLYRLLKLQRQIDVYAPLSTTHLQGTHNSFNSDAYHHLFRYHDRQQRLSLGEQLANGARFLELDTHWTFSAHNFREDLLLCHGYSKLKFLPFHWGCSPFDLPLKSGLQEISAWLQQKENADEVMILYIEDHTDGHHEYLYHLLEETGLKDRIYPSHACAPIPDELTKHDVLAAGKQIILWKDELRLGSTKIECGDNKDIADLAYDSLGKLNRHAEDRTFLGSLAKLIQNGKFPRIPAQEVRQHLLEGANIINFDEFMPNDARLYSLLWTWRLSTDLSQEDSCALMEDDGFWNLKSCDEMHQVACLDASYSHWALSKNPVSFAKAEQACEDLDSGKGFHFSAPVNLSENVALDGEKRHANIPDVWLNIRYKGDAIEVGDKRSYVNKDITE